MLYHMYHTGIIQLLDLYKLIEKDHDEHNKKINLMKMHYRICLYFKR